MTETTDLSSLGEQLKNAREKLGLSIEHVVQKTNLKKNHIEAFENDIFILQNSPPAFVRGYVRNYVRFLCLPESLIDSVNYGQVTLANGNKVKPFPPLKVNNHKVQRRWLRGLTWLVLLTVVGMTLAWWWQEHQKDQASSDELVNKTVENVAETPLTNEIALGQNTTTANESVDLTVPATAPVEDNSAPIESSSATVAEIASETAVPTTNATIADPPSSHTPTNENTTSATNEVVNVLHQLDENSTSATEHNASQEAIKDELHIEIVGGQSWITVRDGKNRRLAEKLYNNGEILTFNNNEQYRVTIGAPVNVKIHYKGQVVPLKLDGRVARLKLPLAQ